MGGTPGGRVATADSIGRVNFKITTTTHRKILIVIQCKRKSKDQIVAVSRARRPLS
jgi:hypothetical protein